MPMKKIFQYTGVCYFYSTVFSLAILSCCFNIIFTVRIFYSTFHENWDICVWLKHRHTHTQPQHIYLT